MTCGSSECAGVCCGQFRKLVVVKGWNTYCIGVVMYDPSAWGNGGPAAQHKWHNTTAGFPASLLVSLPEFSNLHQWLVSFSGVIEGKGGITRELLDHVGGGLGLMPPPFHWSPLSWTQVSGRPGRRGAPEEHIMAGLAAQVPRCGGPQISFLLLFY
jgi:hypothetical protein